VAHPTYDDLMANNAALLKTQLASVADECAKSMESQMISP